jgi:hypothetical protein
VLGWAGVVVLIVIDVALVAAVWGRRAHPLQALGWLLGATIAMFVVDVCTGARLQQASIMGYSPHTATRYYGIGNTALGVLAATTILASAIYLERARRRPDALVVVAGLFVIVVAFDSAPQLGAKVGGILTLVPVLGLLLMAFSGRQLSRRRVAVVGGVLALVLLGSIGVELLRPPAARSHLGQLVSHMGTSGIAPLITTMARKEATNLRVARASVWTWMVPIIAGFMLFLLVLGRRWAELLPPRSARRQAVVAALAAGLVGFAVDDSGVVVTALVFVYLGPFLLLLALGAAQSA